LAALTVNERLNQNPTFVLDVQRFGTLEEFCQEFNRVVFASELHKWQGNLDAFNDFLSWPPAPYTLEWRNSALSRERFGHNAMARRLLAVKSTCHPSNLPRIELELVRAQRGEARGLRSSTCS
jgi:hypothetical protein